MREFRGEGGALSEAEGGEVRVWDCFIGLGVVPAFGVADEVDDSWGHGGECL